jgi:hypothetical protein
LSYLVYLMESAWAQLRDLHEKDWAELREVFATLSIVSSTSEARTP